MRCSCCGEDMDLRSGIIRPAENERVIVEWWECWFCGEKEDANEYAEP